MNFGLAIEALKEGKAVARSGWNGKKMFLWLNRGSRPASPEMSGPLTESVPTSLFDVSEEGTVVRIPNINMRSATGSTVTGWLASQTDILAEDWEIASW